jgi:type VI secretion system secreted protein Hcp
MADDIMIKLTDIQGESKKSGHEGEIDVMSISWGASNSVQTGYGGGGGGAGNASFSDMTFIKTVDSSSNELFRRCANGKPIDEAVVTFRKQGGEQQEYLTITLDNVVISQYTSSAGGSDPTESVGLAYDKIKFEYKEQQEDGSLGGAKTFAWDVKAALETG